MSEEQKLQPDMTETENCTEMTASQEDETASETKENQPVESTENSEVSSVQTKSDSEDSGEFSEVSSKTEAVSEDDETAVTSDSEEKMDPNLNSEHFMKTDSDEPKTPAEKNRSHKKFNFWMAFLMVLLLICLSAGIFFFAAQFESKENVQQSESALSEELEEELNQEEIVDDSTSDSEESNAQDSSTNVELPSENPITLQNVSSELLSAKEVYQKVSPSVVGIQTYETQSNGVEKAYSSGSGIILTEDGYIVTNAHVITNSDGKAVKRIEITFQDTGETVDALFLGADTESDLALIKADATDLTPAEFADSSECSVGDVAYVIGNPTGATLASSMTSGIISGLNRHITTDYGTMTLIQTDAAINPGNSGGALLNESGQVVGIVSSKIVETSYEGIGFAIPSEVAQDIIGDISSNGYVTGRVRIGLSYQMINERISEATGMQIGARVVTIDPESAAYQVLVPGDVILYLDDVEITGSDAIESVLSSKVPGDTVKITYFHVDEDGNETTEECEIQLLEDTTSVVEEE